LTALCGGTMHLLDFNTQMHWATLLLLTNTCFFSFFRFYMFPLAAWDYIVDLQQQEAALVGSRSGYEEIVNISSNEKIILGVKVGVFGMMIFNVGVCVKLAPKNLRYIYRAFNPKVDLEGGVPVALPAQTYQVLAKAAE
jgi:hypothetical protein